MKAYLSLVFLSLVLLPLLVAAGRKDALLGGWTPIKDLNDPHVVEIAKFAVSKYDEKSKAGLKFVSVVRGESQVVAGINYRLVVSASDGSGAKKKYEVVVWEKVGGKGKSLTSFQPVDKV